MLSLLQTVEAISLCRDRDRLPHVLVDAVSAALGSDAEVRIFVREPSGAAQLHAFSASTAADSAITTLPSVLDSVQSDNQLLMCAVGGRNCAAVSLPASELRGEPMVMAIDLNRRNPADHADEILCLTRIYGNQIRLLDYSELDTLTRLLNRKTFDETFDRLLALPVAEGVAARGERRHHPDAGEPAWLCVVDIDHFKRINDSFGHLFGDEVLLRMGDLMRKTFRGGDRLFRFGGEEFVVLLNAADESLAEASFERFRVSVERHEFPQVGKVTCSIGFTRVSDKDVPTDVVGRADEALYYAKESGRNRVCCYEQLVAGGAIVPLSSGRAAIAGGLDIDALFTDFAVVPEAQ